MLAQQRARSGSATAVAPPPAAPVQTSRSYTASQEPKRVTIVKPDTASGPDAPWGSGTMIALVVGTFFLPIIGFVAGLIALRTKSRRTQALALLAFSVIYGFIWLGAFISEFSSAY